MNYFNSIQEALDDLKNGKMIIVVDDEDRENEGDFVMPAQTLSVEHVNFMARHARGLICLTLEEERCPVVAARGFLLRVVWRRLGLLEPSECPGGAL